MTAATPTQRAERKMISSRDTSRRAFLFRVPSLAVAGASLAMLGPQRARGEKMGEAVGTPIHYESLLSMAKLVRQAEGRSDNGGMLSMDLVESHLKRINQIDPKLHAVLYRADEYAKKRARSADDALRRGDLWGPLHGVPFSVKDSISKGSIAPTTMGLNALKEHYPPTVNTVVQRLIDAGGILTFSTSIPTLGLNFETENAIVGRTENPYGPNTYSPGGSTGGGAAAVASGMTPLEIGKDGGGSLRIPGRLCGVFSLKPTRGRVPDSDMGNGSGRQIDRRISHIGPITRYAQDAALVLEVIQGPDSFDPYASVPRKALEKSKVDLSKKRFAYYLSDGLNEPDPAMKTPILKAVKYFEGLGCPITERFPSGSERAVEILYSLLAPRLQENTEKILRKNDVVDPDRVITATFALASHWEKKNGTFEKQVEMDKALDKYLGDWHKFMVDFDYVLTPVMPQRVWKHGDISHPENWNIAAYVAPHNLTGFPAAVVRLGETCEGMPTAVQIIGKPWDDFGVIEVASHLEQSTCAGFRPPLEGLLNSGVNKEPSP